MNDGMLLDKLLDTIDVYAVQKMMNKYKNLRSVFLRVNSSDIDEIIKIVEDVLEEYKGRSEIIKLLIKEGYFMDAGIETFKVNYGFIWEVYDYPTFTYYLVRIFKVTDNRDEKNWAAVYIDENPDTPWWTEEERKFL